jgi:hypothetical protein
MAQALTCDSRSKHVCLHLLLESDIKINLEEMECSMKWICWSDGWLVLYTDPSCLSSPTPDHTGSHRILCWLSVPLCSSPRLAGISCLCSLKLKKGNISVCTIVFTLCRSSSETELIFIYLKNTDYHGQVVNTPALYSGGPRFRSQSRDGLSWLRFFVTFVSPSRQMLG